MDLAAIAAKAAAAQPMAYGSVPIVPNRTLVVDGDGLCYYCAGNDDTSLSEAKANLRSKVGRAGELVGAERTIVLVTGSGSTKGDRYSIARVKPYQGQRANSRRPKNWQGLRDYLTGPDFPYAVEVTYTAEADDLFGWYAYNYPEDTALLTQDKDMRMLPGLHLDWVTNRLHKVSHELTVGRDHYRMNNVVAHNSVFNDKQYGPKWFWLQMLHGDTADNIPGLPKVELAGKLKPVGEVTAGKFLAGVAPANYGINVANYYASYYGDRWLVEMLEQACLLWMRRDPNAWDDCAEVNGPMYQFTDHPAWQAAYGEIETRVMQARNLNDLQTQAI